MENPGDIYSNSRETKAESSSKLQNLKAIQPLQTTQIRLYLDYMNYLTRKQIKGI